VFLFRYKANDDDVLPFSVREIPVAVEFPLPVTVARVEVLATVTVPDPLPVVVISVPAAIVAVAPWFIVDDDPDVAANVNNAPDETIHVEHEMVSVPAD